MTGYLKLVSLCLVLSLTGCKVSPPSTFEHAVAKQVKQKITVRGKNDVNPLPPTLENIKAGQQAFSHYCMVCHGLDGQNTGVPFADRMSPPGPPLPTRDGQGYKDGQLKWIIANGILPPGMPAAHGNPNYKESRQIVHYIRHEPPNGWRAA